MLEEPFLINTKIKKERLNEYGKRKGMIFV